jgi:hypothetical protein
MIRFPGPTAAPPTGRHGAPATSLNGRAATGAPNGRHSVEEGMRDQGAHGGWSATTPGGRIEDG